MAGVVRVDRDFDGSPVQITSLKVAKGSTSRCFRQNVRRKSTAMKKKKTPKFSNNTISRTERNAECPSADECADRAGPTTPSVGRSTGGGAAIGDTLPLSQGRRDGHRRGRAGPCVIPDNAPWLGLRSGRLGERLRVEHDERREGCAAILCDRFRYRMRPRSHSPSRRL